MSKVLKNENQPAATRAHTKVPQPEFNFCWCWEQHSAGKNVWERGFPMVLDTRPRSFIANCRTQLHLGWCEHGLLQLYVPVKEHFWNGLYCRSTCIFFFFFFIPLFLLPLFYFSVSHSFATTEPSIPPELVLDKRTLTVVSNMIHEWKPSWRSV